MLVRKNIRMSKEIAKWYEDKAKDLGISQSSLMVIALGDYIKQEKALNMPADIQFLLNQVKRDSPEKPNEG